MARGSGRVRAVVRDHHPPLEAAAGRMWQADRGAHRTSVGRAPISSRVPNPDLLDARPGGTAGPAAVRTLSVLVRVGRRYAASARGHMADKARYSHANLGSLARSSAIPMVGEKRSVKPSA